MKKNGKSWGQHLLQIGNVLRHRVNWKRVPSQLQATSSVLRQWAIKTQPLSNCVLRACAYQRARQRKMGIAKKKSCQGFGRLFGKGRMFGTPFFKTNPEELSTLCIYPKQLLNNTKKVSIKKRCLSQILPNTLSYNLWGTSHEQQWPWSCSVFGKSALERNAAMFILWTWGKMSLKGIFFSNFWDYML